MDFGRWIILILMMTSIVVDFDDDASCWLGKQLSPNHQSITLWASWPVCLREHLNSDNQDNNDPPPIWYLNTWAFSRLGRMSAYTSWGPSIHFYFYKYIWKAYWYHLSMIWTNLRSELYFHAQSLNCVFISKHWIVYQALSAFVWWLARSEFSASKQIFSRHFGNVCTCNHLALNVNEGLRVPSERNVDVNLVNNVGMLTIMDIWSMMIWY